MKYFSIHQQWVLFIIALLLLGNFYYKYFYPAPSPSSEEFFHPVRNSSGETNPAGTILRPNPAALQRGIISNGVKEVVVEVSGEVRHPGVYLFQNSPTLREAIERAGGLKETAQFDATSSPEILETGTLLIISKGFSAISPSPLRPFPLLPEERWKDEKRLPVGENKGMKNEKIKVIIGRMAANKLLIFSIPIDLNRASFEDLCLIPGIGEALAREMIAYRKRRQGFRSVEEIKNVRGIGEKKYQSFKTFFVIKHERAPKDIF
jgi:competence protein ComEA